MEKQVIGWYIDIHELVAIDSALPRKLAVLIETRINNLICWRWHKYQTNWIIFDVYFFFLKSVNKMSKKQSLLEKYEIPIDNLDFTYVQNCGNIVEIERILEILRSGEEGYYPDLTKSTELRLQKLDANNRMLRTEVQCQRTSSILDAELMVFHSRYKLKNLTYLLSF